MKKLLAILGIGLAANGSATGAEFYKPYSESHVNFLYNQLFCDDLTLFKKQNNSKSEGLWVVLLAEKPDKDALLRIAEDETNVGVDFLSLVNPSPRSGAGMEMVKKIAERFRKGLDTEEVRAGIAKKHQFGASSHVIFPPINRHSELNRFLNYLAPAFMRSHAHQPTDF